MRPDATLTQIVGWKIDSVASSVKQSVGAQKWTFGAQGQKWSVEILMFTRPTPQYRNHFPTHLWTTDPNQSSKHCHLLAKSSHNFRNHQEPQNCHLASRIFTMSSTNTMDIITPDNTISSATNINSEIDATMAAFRSMFPYVEDPSLPHGSRIWIRSNGNNRLASYDVINCKKEP